MTNTYSDIWFRLFLQPIPASQTESEAAFIARNLPNPPYLSITDLCCGTGRHARILTEKGYNVTGVDNNDFALEQAKTQSDPKTVYLHLDMRRLAELPGRFDAMICLWQSFGYFDDTANLKILRQISLNLNPRGRVILDVYNREFFETHQGELNFRKDGVSVTERKRMHGHRLEVSLTYADNANTDNFNWQVFYPDELSGHMKGFGFNCLTACTGFAEDRPPSSESPRMQIVFEKQS